MKKNVLYRFYDASGVLLYVGISMSAAERIGGHKSKAAWFSSAASITFEMHRTRHSAIMAEKKAIINEKPMHNIVHNNSKKIKITLVKDTKKAVRDTKKAKKRFDSQDPQDDPSYRMAMDNPVYVSYLASL